MFDSEWPYFPYLEFLHQTQCPTVAQPNKNTETNKHARQINKQKGTQTGYLKRVHLEYGGDIQIRVADLGEGEQDLLVARPTKAIVEPEG